MQYGTDNTLGNGTTVSTTAGSNVVTGSADCEWSSYLQPGDEILIGSDVVFFVIASVDSDTQVTLTANYPSTVTDEDYVAHTDFTTNRGYPKANQGDLHFADIYTRAMQMIDNDAQFGLTWMGTIVDKDLDAAPGSGVSVGDQYIVAATPASGDEWLGKTGYIAEYVGTSGAPWTFTEPTERMFVWVDDENKLYLYVGGAWEVWGVTAGTGDVVGPDGATDGVIAVYDGVTGKLLKNSTMAISSVVAGPATATDNAVARFDETTGKLLQNSPVTIADSGRVVISSNETTAATVGELQVATTTSSTNPLPLKVSARTGSGNEGDPALVGAEIAVFKRNPSSAYAAAIAILGGSAGTSAMYFGDKDDIDVGAITYTHGTTNAFAFTAGANANRMTLDGSGNMTIAGNLTINTTQRISSAGAATLAATTTTDLAASGKLSLGTQTVAVTGNGQTVTPTASEVILTTSANRTGLILANGTVDRQRLRLVMGSASYTVTMPVASNLSMIGGDWVAEQGTWAGSIDLIWDADTSKWHEQARTRRDVRVVGNALTPVSNSGSSETDLQSVVLPATTMAYVGDAVEIEAYGSAASDGNAKRIKLYFGATALWDSGSVIFEDDWHLRAVVHRTGSNTEKAVVTVTSDSIVVASKLVLVSGMSIDLSSAVTIKTTGQGTDSDQVTSEALTVTLKPIK